MAGKITSERSQKQLQELFLIPGNNICADCKTTSPRWASHNLGIFLCVHCASIHRKIGTHISKVKSVTMDLWTKEQVETMRSIGNIKSNAIFNPNEIKHPPPPPLMDATRDNELEQYIRSKYEYKRFLDKSALVASKLGPSRSATSIAPRPQTTPIEKATPPVASRPSTLTSQQTRSASQPVPQQSAGMQSRIVSQPPPQQQQTQNGVNGVWADLVQLQNPAPSSSLPLQYQQNTTSSLPMQYHQQQQPMAGMNYQQQSSPYNPFLQQQQQQQQLQQQQQQQAQQYFQNQVQVQSPIAQPASYMYSPQPQMQQQQYGQMSPTPQLMSTTPQLMSTTPQLMSTTPQLMNPYQMTPSPSINYMPQQSPSINFMPQQQQQPQQQYSLPPMGGGAWPQPMYQQQQPMMQQGQWSAM